MEENNILMYLQRDAAEFNIDDFMVMIGREELLTQEEEQQFIALAQRGDTEAVARVLNANMRFVVSLARQYTRNGIPLQLLIRSGVQELEQAIKTYNPASDQKFINFAVPMMRDVISSYVQNNKPRSVQ